MSGLTLGNTIHFSSEVHKSATVDDEIPRFKVRQINAMNYQADLQAIYIALLARHCTITIGRPHRLSHLTKQFIKIKKIVFSNLDSIDVLQFIQTRSNEQAQHEYKTGNTTQKTAKRRIQPTKRREEMRFLQDILFEFGYYVEISSETIDGYEGSVSLYSKKGSITTNSIRLLGDELNKKLSSILEAQPNALLNSSSFKETSLDSFL
ncbi:hypothetical protein EIN_274890 [Entamoeba invadens IP1]|uniref:Uncharacterized protein n=1 Tax=Entamoeba invadens IP1 TaxID=370355 RepID=A0A0A1U1L3_ENTIV|nr:hypothetical protein EIN_274890 [Entamoeba invadens IP1]ELP87902.1 hypothetical protein EIN_274890 [Entamoeba invadens IP1]|eukprot:XP_004254673.1 hypothetical protein EIN_274890 [Entamoeba invadens IP1]